MDVRNRGVPLFLFLLISAILLPSFSVANQLLHGKKSSSNVSVHSLLSSTVFLVRGNVYPLGYYTVSLNMGNPPKPFELDIDTGSDLTWVQCDVRCKGCTLPKEKLYKPTNNNLVKCSDPLCAAISSPPQPGCTSPSTQCDYEVRYADHGSSKGVLVRDNVLLRTNSREVIKPVVAFGCGFDQEYTSPTPPPTTGGVLGLGNGKISILSQLASQDVIRNVLGHCFSSKGGGFLFFGDELVPKSGIVWVPILKTSSKQQHYNTGPADLLFNKKLTAKGLQLIFDSGSSYTYFNSQTYNAVVNMISNDLKGKLLSRATQDPTLPVCWKGKKPFRSVSDVNSYFQPLALVFTSSRNSVLLLPPVAYLIISQQGNACLGILDGTQIGLGNVNVIGDISLQDKVVIYDNENQRIGWASANCNRRLE